MNNKILKNQDGEYSVGREKRWIDGIKFVLDLLTREKELNNIKIKLII